MFRHICILKSYILSQELILTYIVVFELIKPQVPETRTLVLL